MTSGIKQVAKGSNGICHFMGVANWPSNSKESWQLRWFETVKIEQLWIVTDVLTSHLYLFLSLSELYQIIARNRLSSYTQVLPAHSNRYENILMTATKHEYTLNDSLFHKWPIYRRLFTITNAHLNIFESGYGLHSLKVENTLQFYEGSHL